MELPQNAEHYKLAIETIINSFQFNKAKISSVVCDEGKNLLRLFKSADGTYYLDSEAASEEQYEIAGEDSDISDEEDSNDNSNDNNSDDEIIKDLNETYLNLNLNYKIREKPSNQYDYATVADENEYDLEKGILINSF